MNTADLPPTSTIRRRGTLVVPILVVLLLSPFLIAATPVGASNAGTFEQWFDGSPSKWTTGGINDNASYREGDVVPFRVPFKGLTPGAEYSFTVEYDALVRHVRGYDELKPYGTTESTDPCAGQTCTGHPTDVEGAFSIWGGAIEAVVPGVGTTSNNGTRHDAATVTFTADTASPLIAWGGHLAKPTDETSADGASYISGSPLEMDTDVTGVLHLSAGAWLREPDPEPDPTCTGTITATMVDGATDDPVAGTVTPDDGGPALTVNDTVGSTADCGGYNYTATAASGWRFVSGTTNPQTATVTDGQTTTLTWTVEPAPLTCPSSATVPNEDGAICVQPEGPAEGSDPVVEEEEVTEEEQDPIIVDDPKDPAVIEDPVVEDGEAVCQGGLGLRVTDLLGEPVPGASVALGGETHSLTSGQYDETLPCGSVEVELTSIPGDYVFVRTEVHGTSTFSALSTHTKSRKVSAVVSDDASSTVVFVVDPLEVMPEEITGPTPERDPLGAPNPAPAQDDPQPAPQPAPVEPVAAPTLPRTGIPAGRLLALAILMLTAGSAMLGSRRSVDRWSTKGESGR